MSTKLIFLVILSSAAAIQIQNDLSSNTKAMEAVFIRSEDAHKLSMASITDKMTLAEAAQTVEKSNKSTPELMQLVNMATGKLNSNLRKQAPKGYAGLDGARKLLNDMIFESMTKYDEEIAKCTEYYTRQCASMEQLRGQISAANYEASNSRMLILDAQACINQLEVDIPAKMQERTEHQIECKSQKAKLNARLKIVMGDIAVMTTILEMTDCEKGSVSKAGGGLVQIARCTDQCTHKSFVEFKHDGLQKKVNRLKSSVSKNLMQDTFKDLFEGVKDLQSVEFLQTNAQIEPLVNKTKFNNPPLPRTKVPGNPCTMGKITAPAIGSTDPNQDRQCRLIPGKCYKLQERFLLIQAGIQDERDTLEQNLAMLEHFCDKTEKSLSAQIQHDQDTHDACQTDLAKAMSKEAKSGEKARAANTEFGNQNKDLVVNMETCQKNYGDLENEICAFKRIRGELYKMKGDGHSGFFQDCEVSKWSPEECTKTCTRDNEAPGMQKLTRDVMTHPQGGTKCLPLAAERSCGNQPCKVDCLLEPWSGWSKCSAECGGGVTQRLREVKRAPKHDGAKCGATSEEVVCNNQACEEDCKLSAWTSWGICSKDCDGGTKKRQKFVLKPARGDGQCPRAWAKERLQYKPCNMHRCELMEGFETLTCDKKLDVVLLLDGSGSLGRQGWNAEIKAAKMFVKAFSVQGSQAAISVILYSGPRTWSGVFKCIAKNKNKVNIKETCKVSVETHFNNNTKAVLDLIGKLQWPGGSTLTSLALMTAKAELNLGRKGAQADVVVFTDGRPLSFKKTGDASKLLRKSSRLIWVPVTRYAPLSAIKDWATRRWEENVVQVPDFKALEKPDVITHVIANMCPAEEPQARFAYGTQKTARYLNR